MRLLLASIRCEKGDLEGNLARHVEVLDQARRAGCHLVVFPELSLTGSVDPSRHPEGAVTLDDEAVRRLASAADRARVSALFGICERRGRSHHITQVHALDGRAAGVQRKRHLGEGEEAFRPAEETSVFEHGALRFGAVICAESGVAHTWDATVAAGARLVCFSSAPGLHGRRLDEASWRHGYDWWRGSGLADARRHARRLGVWVAMATQAGATVDEDFPGIAALVAPSGDVVEELPGWHPGTLVVDVPLQVDVEPVRRAVRVVVLDESGRALLCRFADERTGRTWWVPPGGGMEAGEREVDTARRELLEELGRDDLDIGPPVGRRGGTFRFNGSWFTQHERFFVCRSPHFEVDPGVLARCREEGIIEMRWMSTDEIRSTGIDTGPRGLPDLVDQLVAGRLPDPEADLGM